MSSPVTLLNKLPFEPIVKPGQLVVIHPTSVFGVYEVKRDAQIEFLPPKIFNVATPFTTSVAAASRTAQAPSKKAINDLDMSVGKLAQLRLGAIDNLLFKIFQPAAVGRYANEAGSLSIDLGTTLEALRRGLFQQLPEIFIFEDKTEPTIEATNYQFTATFYARMFAVGFSYELTKSGLSEEEAQPALNIRTQASKNV